MEICKANYNHLSIEKRKRKVKKKRTMKKKLDERWYIYFLLENVKGKQDDTFFN